MDTSLLVIFLVFMVSVDYTVSQSDLGNRGTVGSFEYGESLRIVSPNYPDNYPNDVNTHWLVSGPEDYQIVAVFSTFQLEENYDILKIGSGLDGNDTSSLLATLTGSSLPGVIISPNNVMWLVFTSDSSVTKQGFRVDFMVFTPENITDLSNKSSTFGYGESLTIVSPNYPYRYPNDANTHWLVSGPADYQIMAVFSNFQLENNYDFLRIGSGLHRNDTESLLAILSGSSLPGIIVSPDNEMWLVFTSDGSNTKQGFRIDIRVFTPGNISDDMMYSTSFHDSINITRSDDMMYSTSFHDSINITRSETFFADTCFEESCFSEGETTVCRCDNVCQFFGDCCPDYPVPILNETLSNETAIDLDVWECVLDSYLPQFYPDLRHGYRMIAKCPSEWSSDEDIKRNCEDVPANATRNVLYVLEDMYFRNLGCATCHGYEESSLTAIVISADQQCRWGINNTLECMRQMPTSQSNISMNTNGSGIYVTDVQTVPKPRLCLVNITESCPSGTNNATAVECQYHYKPFISEGIVSKHPGCRHCSGGPLMTCPIIMYFDDEVPYIDDIEINEPLERGVIDVFRIDEPDMSIPIPIPIEVLHCLDGFELDENGNCSPISSDWPVCELKYFGVTQSNGTEECLEDMLCFKQMTIDNVTFTLRAPPPCLVRSSMDLINDTITFSLTYRDDMNPSLDTIQRDIIQRVQTLSREQCENIAISVSQSCYVGDTPGNITNFCPEEVFAGHYLDFMPSRINNETLIFSNGTYIMPKWWSNVSNTEFSNANVSSEYQLTLCGTKIALQTCSFFIVSNDSAEWISQENQSVILHQGKVYDAENVLKNPDGSISICYIDQDAPIGGRALMILGHVLFAISSVFLFSTFITYVAFSTLRNRQGVSIMNFIVALFFGQIFLQYIRLSVSNFPIPCIVVAALSHFFFLASFVWTTILAWDLSRSFAASKMKSFSSSTFGRKMVAFLLIGWGIPLVFVLITLVLQFGGFRKSPILEYDSNTCWLTKLASIAMFFVPMSVCLLSNLVLFIITVHGVHSTKKTTSMLKHGRESQFKQWVVELRIYVKISALLGFGWLFGFLAMVIRVPFMEYLFIIVIGLQGVFIFISFSANERARKLWRTAMESSTLWSTLSRREYSLGRSSAGTHNGHNSEKH